MKYGEGGIQTLTGQIERTYDTNAKKADRYLPGRWYGLQLCYIRY